MISNFFIIVFGCAWIAFILGMIKPSLLKVFRTRKKVALVLLPAIFLLAILASVTQTPEQKAASAQKQQQEKALADQKKADEKKQKEEDAAKEKQFHMHDIEKILQEDVYKKIAQQYGTGAPTVDVSFANYVQWESAPGLTESKGTFTLSSEKGLTHEFSARWGKNSNELIRLEVDGQKIYYSEELQDKYLDMYDPQKTK